MTLFSLIFYLFISHLIPWFILSPHRFIFIHFFSLFNLFYFKFDCIITVSTCVVAVFLNSRNGLLVGSLGVSWKGYLRPHGWFFLKCIDFSSTIHWTLDYRYLGLNPIFQLFAHFFAIFHVFLCRDVKRLKKKSRDHLSLCTGLCALMCSHAYVCEWCVFCGSSWAV